MYKGIFTQVSWGRPGLHIDVDNVPVSLPSLLAYSSAGNSMNDSMVICYSNVATYIIFTTGIIHNGQDNFCFPL